MIPGLPPPNPAYATHFPVLASVVASTTGAVAEVGSGQFSTPLLESLVHPPRRWTSFETDLNWLHSLRHPRLPNHDLRIIDPLQVPDLSDYEVALIDGGEPSFRADIALGCGARIIVCHDANPDWEPTYHYRERLLRRFRFHAFYCRLNPWSLIVSDFVDPRDLMPRGLLFKE